MEKQIELFAAVNFTVFGLSHIFQPRVWVDFFIWLRSKGRTGVFVNGFLSLGFGSLIAALHPVWHGLPLVLTLIGWAQVLKGIVSFVAPQLALKGLARVSPERAWEFVAGGCLALGIAGLQWHLVFAS